MTYSRPAIGTVSVRGPGDRAPRTQIVGNTGGVRQAPNARLIDASSVEIAGKNAGQGAAEISKFLNDFAPIVKDVGKALLEQQANRQLGELQATDPTLGERYRNADPDAQAKIDTLSPLTKDLFIRSQMATSQRAYQEVFPVLALADSRLTAANARENPEEYAQALNEVQTKAESQSGLAALPPGVRGAMAADLGQINGAVRGKLYSAQERQQQSDNAVMTGDGMVTDIDKLGDDIKVERKNGGDTTALFKAGQQAYADDVKRRTSSGQTTPLRHLSSVLGRAAVKLDRYRESGQFQQAEQLLDVLEVLSNGELKLDNGLNYWEQSIKVGDQGKTVNVSSFISSQRKITEQGAKKENVRDVEEKILPLALRVQAGDQTAVPEFQALVPLIAKNPDALKAALSVFSVSQNFGEQLTVNDADLLSAVYDPGRDRDAVAQRIIGRMQMGSLSAPMAMTLLQRNLQGREDPADPNVRAANAASIAAQSGMLEAQALYLTRKETERAREKNTTVPTDLQKQNTRFLKGEAFNRTVEQINTAAESGTPLTKEEVNQAYLDNVQAIVNEKIEQLADPDSLPDFVPIGQVIADDLNAMRSNILNGKKGIEMFPPRLIELAVQKGIDLKAPDAMSRVSKLLYGQMGAVTDKNGNKEYPEPGEQIKEMIRDAKRERGNGVGNGGWQRGIDAQTDAMERGVLIPPNEGATKKNGDQSALPQQLMQGLQQVAGVVLPGGSSSAKAGELPEMTVNDDQIELLAKLWSGREQPTLTTPAAPQVAANSPTRPIPLAIRNDRHEFFIAIGIAEGTRTPNGGYTRAYYGHRDPGDNNYNRGTVSGGRGNNLSPKQVDARWMGLLTDSSIRWSPVLKQLGLQPGTQGYNRTMFNILDLTVQAPAAVRDFVAKLNRVKGQNWTVEALAKARADSFYRYNGTLDAPGFNNDYGLLFRDQRSRAGAFDYKKRF